MGQLNIAGITQEAKTYQPQLKMLPYYILAEVLSQHGIQLMQVAGIDIITQGQRKGGLLKPYDPANVDYSDEILKFREAKLETKIAVISMKDSIKNYQGKKLMNLPQAGTGQNQTKKHPFEGLIISQVVVTAAEDILDALFSAEYDITDRSPQGCFDGFDKIITDLVTSTEISVGNKNLVATGVIAAPVSDTDYLAVEKLVAFVRAASPFLKKNGILYITNTVYLHAVDALENKMSNKDWDLQGVQDYINKKAGSKIVILVTDFMGTGDRILLTVAGNLHFGMDTFGDETFVDVRTPYEDPNIMQFWLQAEFGARVVSIHQKEFQINDGTPVPMSMSGDY